MCSDSCPSAARAFLSTPSARRATNAYHKGGLIAAFLSTPSARRSTKSTSVTPPTTRFLSTPSARRATPHHSSILSCTFISIHALREEGDYIGLSTDNC